MTPQHMIEHLIQAIRLSDGKTETKCFSPEDKLPVLKKILMSNRPLPKLFINPLIGEDLFPLEFPNLDSAKQSLLNEIEYYREYYKDNPDAKHMNPTFGLLNKEEWDHFHKKHFAHHFSQFGLI
jgi:oxepin-CoA hydrolase/3-oxo-5,6-dehydrosuberyl-CoA semialdehyde dehydrogenase